MARKTIKLPSMDNVAAGSTAVQKCPTGPTYDEIIIEYSGVTRAQMSNIEVNINGKTVQKFSDGDRLQAINNFYGRPDKAGYLTLFFARPEQTSLEHERATALGTTDVQTLNVSIDIDAAAAGPVITCYAVQSEAQPLGLLTKVKEFNLNSAVSGQIEVDEIVRGPRLMAVHLIKSDITDVEIDADSVRVFEGSKNILEAIQENHGRVPQTASMTHVDFMLEGDHAQAVLTSSEVVQDFRLRPTLGTSGALTVVVEYLDGFAGI